MHFPPGRRKEAFCSLQVTTKEAFFKRKNILIQKGKKIFEKETNKTAFKKLFTRVATYHTHLTQYSSECLILIVSEVI